MGQDNSKVVVGIVSSNKKHENLVVKQVEKLGSQVHIINRDDVNNSSTYMENVDCFLFADGPAIHPSSYKNGPDNAEQGDSDKSLDQFELHVLQEALDRDVPILGISRGMHLMNVVFGGGIEVGIFDHDSVFADGREASSFHRIFISPGSRLAATVGSGGFVRVNSRHNEGIKEAQKSKNLLSTAWSMEDGLVEAVESPNHGWVLGVQFIPYIGMEIPPHFDRLFEALIYHAKTTI